MAEADHCCAVYMEAPDEGRVHRGWHQPHGLPHFDSPEIVQFITFRRADSLPTHLTDVRESPTEMRRRVHGLLDRGYGACWMSNPDIAEIVERALLAFDRDRYRLWAWCIMPNHVHVLFEALNGWRLADVVKSWKAYSAAKANRLIGRKGAFWQPDYFDRFMRDEEQMRRTIDYIERNPVHAGLCTHPFDWRWSSAFWRKSGRLLTP